MMSTSHLDQLFNSAYQPTASSTSENEVEKQLIQLQAEKGIQQEPVTDEDMEALREYVLNPSTHSSSDSSSPADAGDWDYPDPTLADMRKVLGNPNSDVGVAEGGYYFVSGMRFMFEDVAVLLDPESTPDEIALAYMFTFFKPLKAADKGLDLAGGGKKAEDVGGKGVSNSKWKSSELLDELENSGVKFNPDEVMALTKTASGKLVWLEKGTSNGGFEHVMRHVD
ncbi:hypothetical protein P6709_06495 [Jeotgalibacillus sp. ET6]|uniref:hypothetical protein n=1 Tax=Jeotgalibacillus sp. ET6 TaxID=3037260 RepID=UPI0024184045|nr:hypothetical protein [Jeotgalibacillus sp. ET6]MDG5471390.1 hypothetical protein [Jeotgalibacillus sp. ET6]